jgi:hypothetical protein
MRLKGIELGIEPDAGVVNSRSGICLVLGSSPSLFQDVKDATDLLMGRRFEVMACNLSFLGWTGQLDHLVSLHQEKLSEFWELSKTIPVDRPGYTLKHKAADSADKSAILWDILDKNGTSALFCVKVAHLLGYEKIILCGVSLEGNHRFYDNPFFTHKNNMGCDAIAYSWNEFFWLPYRAMSGKPMAINGKPTQEWLNG